jgi:quinol monooxygenase YgiN
MNSKLEFDSEFCNVRYMENDNVVFLVWKKFANSDDYRKPTLFALDLLKQYPHSNFVIDARNGFEDEKEDVEWGFSEFIPNISKTDCKYIIFIMQKVTDIEEEMDMWTKEFGKYFSVIKAESYERAISKMNKLILVNVRYTIKPGKRDEFLEKVIQQGIIRKSKEEPGNVKYEYYIPVGSENVLFLMEMWVNSATQIVHGKTEHYQRLQVLKEEYVTDVTIEKYSISQRL